MAAHLHKGSKVLELDPGQSLRWKFNNASDDRAYGANAVPVPTGSSTSGFDEDAKLEVTRVWRRLWIKPTNPDSQTTTLEGEHEIHCEVKNVGNRPAAFRVYFYSIG